MQKQRQAKTNYTGQTTLKSIFHKLLWKIDNTASRFGKTRTDQKSSMVSASTNNDYRTSNEVRAIFLTSDYMKFLARATCALMLLTLLPACSTLSGAMPSWLGGESDKELAEMTATMSEQETAEALYREALREMEAGNYAPAARGFDEIEQQFPYADVATQSKLMAAYAWYRDLDYARASNAYERFIELHPGHPDIAYAYYMKALCAYEQIVDVRRDAGQTRTAMLALREVTQRFPDSQYAQNAALKYDLTRDHLAGKEMDVGRYYQRREQWHAALRRYQGVVDDYETTRHVAEALHRQVEVYLTLGLDDQANRVGAILAHNHGDTVWYQASYALLTGQSPDQSLQTEDDWRKWLDDTLFGS